MKNKTRVEQALVSGLKEALGYENGKKRLSGAGIAWDDIFKKLNDAAM